MAEDTCIESAGLEITGVARPDESSWLKTVNLRTLLRSFKGTAPSTIFLSLRGGDKKQPCGEVQAAAEFTRPRVYFNPISDLAVSGLLASTLFSFVKPQGIEAKAFQAEFKRTQGNGDNFVRVQSTLEPAPRPRPTPQPRPPTPSLPPDAHDAANAPGSSALGIRDPARSAQMLAQIERMMDAPAETTSPFAWNPSISIGRKLAGPLSTGIELSAMLAKNEGLGMAVAMQSGFESTRTDRRKVRVVLGVDMEKRVSASTFVFLPC